MDTRYQVWTGENDTETINVDANLFENGTKQYRFRLKTVSVDGVLLICNDNSAVSRHNCRSRMHSFFHKNIVLRTETGYSYFLAEFRLRIFSRILLTFGIIGDMEFPFLK